MYVGYSLASDLNPASFDKPLTQCNSVFGISKSQDNCSTPFLAYAHSHAQRMKEKKKKLKTIHNRYQSWMFILKLNFWEWISRRTEWKLCRKHFLLFFFCVCRWELSISVLKIMVGQLVIDRRNSVCDHRKALQNCQYDRLMKTEVLYICIFSFFS